MSSFELSRNSSGEYNSYEIEIEEVEALSDAETLSKKSISINEDLESEENGNYLNTIDLKSKLCRWANNSEIPYPKLNSLLNILTDYHQNIPNNASSLLGVRYNQNQNEIFTNQPINRHNICDIKSKNKETAEISLNKHVNDIILNLKNNIDRTITQVENIVRFNFENDNKAEPQDETGIKEYPNISLPLMNTEELDDIHRSMSDLEFQNQLINELKQIKDDYGFDTAFKKTMSDKFLSNYKLKNYGKHKGFVSFDFYTKILFKAWRNADMGLKEFTNKFSKLYKRSVDRQYLKVKSKRKIQ